MSQKYQKYLMSQKDPKIYIMFAAKATDGGHNE